MDRSIHQSIRLRPWKNFYIFFALLSSVLGAASGHSVEIDIEAQQYVVEQQPFLPQKSPFLNIPSISFDHRRRAAEETDEVCDICAGLHGSGILANAPIPSFPDGFLSSDPPNEGTCSDWDKYLGENSQSGSNLCKRYTYFLSPQCCDRSNMTASYICESNLKSTLLGDDSGYETTAVPVPVGNRSLYVTVSVTFYHISSLDTVEGTAEIFFGIDLLWMDERLAWDPAEFDGCLDLAVRASLDVETTDIYVPDFNLLNRAEGVQSLPAEQALVTPDGTVRWRRNGGLKGLCAFTGLEPIPFDTLGCYFSFGTITGHKVHYQFGPGDPHTPGLFFAHFPAKYQQFSLIPERSSTYITGANLLAIPILRYQFYFSRANSYYITKIVIPTILFTYLSFGTFLLDQRVGERLSYGVSLLLVIVANSIVTADMLPISDEKLWVDTFALASYYWVIFAVLESVVVAYLYFLDSEEEREEKQAREEEEKQAREEKRERELSLREDAFRSNTVNNDIKEEVITETPSYSIEVAVDNSNRSSSNAAVVSHTSELLNKNSQQSATSLSAPRPQLQRTSGRGAVFFTQILTRKKKPTLRKKLQMIQTMDRFCLIFLPVTYTIFVIVMFATASKWD